MAYMSEIIMITFEETSDFTNFIAANQLLRDVDNYVSSLHLTTTSSIDTTIHNRTLWQYRSTLMSLSTYFSTLINEQNPVLQHWNMLLSCTQTPSVKLLLDDVFRRIITLHAALTYVKLTTRKRLYMGKKSPKRTEHKIQRALSRIANLISNDITDIPSMTNYITIFMIDYGKLSYIDAVKVIDNYLTMTNMIGDKQGGVI